MRKTILAVILTVPLVASAADLVTNGDFETYSVPFSGYSTVLAGSSALAGWTVGGTSVDVVNGNFGAITGNSIDMLGTPGPGSLSQTLATVSGSTYVLTFSLGANMGSDNSQDTNGNYVSKALNISLNNAPVATFYGTSTVQQESLAFTANSGSTVLAFTSAASGYSGAVLDNVSVAAVPEPQSYAMFLAGLGLVGTIIRRRKGKDE